MNPIDEANTSNGPTLEPPILDEVEIGAWSEDGQVLLAAAPTVDELVEMLDHIGVTRFLVGRVPPVDSWLGGFWDVGGDWGLDATINQDGAS